MKAGHMHLNMIPKKLELSSSCLKLFELTISMSVAVRPADYKE